MHHTQTNLIDIQNKIKEKITNLSYNNYNPKIIAVSKTFSEKDILPLLNHGHGEFGENKVQEALQKWGTLKENYKNVKLHMLGKLQTNKVKHAVEIFDYIHSLDNLKLAKKLAKEIHEKNKKIKLFIQINLGDEKQKSGINKNELQGLVTYCKEINLDLIGLMCIPPANIDPEIYFEEMKNLNRALGFTELSMGMSSDFLKAAEHKSTYIRIGSSIFGQRL